MIFMHFYSYILVICKQVVEVPNVSWEDIGGLENVKRELQEVIFFFYTTVSLVGALYLLKFDLVPTFYVVDCSISCGTSREV